MRKQQKLLVISAVGAAMIVIGVWNGAGRKGTERDDTVWNAALQNNREPGRWGINLCMNEKKTKRDEQISGQEPGKESERVQKQAIGKSSENALKEELLLTVDEKMIKIRGKERNEIQKEDKSMNIELTKTEEDVLKKISVDESAIEQGLLLTWQKELIWDMREATAALEAAYPSHTFQIVDASDNRMDTSTKSVFWFVADGGEKRYVLYLSEEDGNKAMRDTFFGTLLSEPYEQAFLSWIQKKVPACIGCQVSFDCAVGEAYTEASVRTVMQALLKGEDVLANFTELYVDGTDCEDPKVLAGQLEREIRRQGICGSYEIAVLLQRPEETAVHAKTDGKETIAHAETDEKETIAHTKTGREEATAHMEEMGGHTYIEPEMESKAETEQTSETDIEKERIESKNKELKTKEDDVNNIINDIDKNRNNDRCVWIYAFSCFV